MSSLRTNETNEREESVGFGLVKDSFIRTDSVANDPSLVIMCSLFPACHITEPAAIFHLPLIRMHWDLNVVYDSYNAEAILVSLFI